MCYLTTRGDSSVKRSQPLVIFGINSGSLCERRKVTDVRYVINGNLSKIIIIERYIKLRYPRDTQRAWRVNKTNRV